MAPDALFITGTDTGVGKTAVAAAIALLWKEGGRKVAACKPVETGVDVHGGGISDAEILMRASGLSNIDDSRLYSLKHPLAPLVAAEIEDVEIDTKRIVAFIRELQTRYSAVVVEGAGGPMVPIRWDYFFLDLIAELAVPTLIVARAGLGTINHTLLTYHALKARGVDIFAIVLNGCPSDPGHAEKTNPDVLRRITGFQRVYSLPHCQGDCTLDVARALIPFVRDLFDRSAVIAERI